MIPASSLHPSSCGLLPALLPHPSPRFPGVILTLPLPCLLLVVSPTATATPRITRSNSIPTHDSTFELYSTSQMGSTLSLADKPKGMIRSGSFRDPVDDGESVLHSCPGGGGSWGRRQDSPHTCPFLLDLLQHCWMSWCIQSSVSEEGTAALRGLVDPSALGYSPP